MMTVIHCIRTLATLGLLVLGIVRLIHGGGHAVTITIVGALTFLLSLAYWRVEARAVTSVSSPETGERRGTRN